MNRFEKKCFVGSATFHGVLLAVIFLGAAFSSNKLPSDMGPTITMLPNPGAAPSGNGAPPPAAPPVKPAPPEPEPPQLKPETVKQPDPEPPVKVKPPKREESKETEEKKGELPVPVKKPNDKKLAKEPQKTNAPTSLISKTLIRQKDFVDPQAKQRADAQRERDSRATRIAQANEQARRDAALAEMNDILRGNGTGLGHSPVASPNSIGGGGGEGVASGRYGDGLKAIYHSKWILNADAYDDVDSATVRVTVRRDGTVVSSTITKPSGNASFDRSVRAVLNNVTRVPPFTPDMKGAECVFTWVFEKTRRAG